MNVLRSVQQYEDSIMTTKCQTVNTESADWMARPYTPFASSLGFTHAFLQDANKSEDWFASMFLVWSLLVSGSMPCYLTLDAQHFLWYRGIGVQAYDTDSIPHPWWYQPLIDPSPASSFGKIWCTALQKQGHWKLLVLHLDNRLVPFSMSLAIQVLIIARRCDFELMAIRVMK